MLYLLLLLAILAFLLLLENAFVKILPEGVIMNQLQHPLLAQSVSVPPTTTPISTTVAKTQNEAANRMLDKKYFNQYDTKIKAVASKYGVPWQWIKGIALNESLLGELPAVKKGEVSSDGKSYGIMQFTFPTAKDMMGRDVTKDELNNNDFSFELAGKYLQKLSKMFNGEEAKVIKSYNQGPGNTKAGKTYADEYYKRFLKWKAKL